MAEGPVDAAAVGRVDDELHAAIEGAQIAGLVNALPDGLDTVVGELVAGSRYNDYTDVYKKWFGRNPPPQRFYAAAPK